MRKRRWLSLVFVPLLLACAAKEGNSSSPSSSSWINDDPLPLEKDTSERYEFADSSNENGSMNYEIFVRSFYDSDGDGIGDLNGVKAKLPYLADMGYKTLWLMPIFPSPTYHGYDVTDYYAVNEDYGTLDDLISLVAEAATYNIDIMLDMVLNHCSIQHEYFKTAFNDYVNANYSSDSKADWFNFGPGGDHVYNGVYYESRFDANMPDFNLDSAGVRAEIENIVKFWIEKGIKGFRLDAVLYYYYQNTSKNVEFLNWLTEIAHKYDPSFYMAGKFGAAIRSLTAISLPNAIPFSLWQCRQRQYEHGEHGQRVHFLRIFCRRGGEERDGYPQKEPFFLFLVFLV